MPPAARLLCSGLTVAVTQGLLACASLLAMGLEPTTWWIALSGALTAAVTVLAYRLVVRPGPAGPGSDHNGPTDEPPWWPEFERAFRAHAESTPAPCHQSTSEEHA